MKPNILSNGLLVRKIHEQKKRALQVFSCDPLQFLALGLSLDFVLAVLLRSVVRAIMNRLNMTQVGEQDSSVLQRTMFTCLISQSLHSPHRKCCSMLG